MREKAPRRRGMVVLLGAAPVALGACAARGPAAAPPAAPAANEAAQGSGAGSANAAAGADEEAAGPQAGGRGTHPGDFRFPSSEVKGTRPPGLGGEGKGHPRNSVHLLNRIAAFLFEKKKKLQWYREP